MLKRKRVYICDRCGAVALETLWGVGFDCWKGPPDGWTKLGKEDLCPICSEAYERFRNEVVKEKVNASEEMC